MVRIGSLWVQEGVCSIGRCRLMEFWKDEFLDGGAEKVVWVKRSDGVRRSGVELENGGREV